MLPGDPVKGVLHSADASAGVEIPMYSRGTETVRTVAANEYLEIDSIELVTAPGGDCYVLIGPDASLGTGETIVRGTYAVTGGVSEPNVRRAGNVGEKPFVVAPAGVVDVAFTGRIMKGQTQGQRPSWKESMVPGV
jgi:hypothetical protein